jgi:penicillin-binding protein 2
MSPPRRRRLSGAPRRLPKLPAPARQRALQDPVRPQVPKPMAVLKLDEDSAERTRARITSSPLRRVEEDEKEQERRSETVHTGLRLTVMGVVVLGLFTMMLIRLWSLQVLQGPNAARYEHLLSTRVLVVAPPRGLILSRDGSIVVANKVMSVVTLNRQVAANDPAVIGRLAVALDVSIASINTDIADQQDSIYQPVPVALGVSAQVIANLSEHKAEFPGVTVGYVAERSYPDGEVGAQMLGYVSDITSSELKIFAKDGYLASDVFGQSGIEAQYENFLRGKDGKITLQVDALGDPVGSPSTTSATSGDDVVLNIDDALEKYISQVLANEISSLRASGKPATTGAAVVINPQNGAVYAMVSYPSYNPEWWVGGMSTAHYAELTAASSQYPLLNRVIQGLYQPGSTFKLATATAALDTGLISPYTPITDPGYFTIPGKCTGICTFINNESESCGACDVQTALTISDDVFFYTMGYDFWAAPNTYGTDPIQKAAASYGFGVSSGVDLPGEYYGQVDSPQLRVLQFKEAPGKFATTYYGPADAIQTAFGQGETVVTPLQLANAFATFANGGTRYAPEVAAAIISPTGHLVKLIRPKVMGHVRMSPSTWNAIYTGLYGVVNSGTSGDVGTAYSAFQGYPRSRMPLFGKTGTATVSSNKNVQPTALFVACGPATGNPHDTKFCAAVVIPYGGYGASAAAPVVRDIFQYLIDHPLPPLSLKAPANVG